VRGGRSSPTCRRNVLRDGRAVTSASAGACLPVGVLWGFPARVSLVGGDLRTSRLLARQVPPHPAAAGRGASAAWAGGKVTACMLLAAKLLRNRCVLLA